MWATYGCFLVEGKLRYATNNRPPETNSRPKNMSVHSLSPDMAQLEHRTPVPRAGSGQRQI